MQTPTKGKALVGIIYQRKFQGKKYREEQGEPIMIRKKRKVQFPRKTKSCYVYKHIKI